MIFKHDCYGLECDKCGKIYQNENTGFSMFVDKNTAKEEATDDCWAIGEDDKSYCPHCYTFDDEGNTFVKHD